MAKLQVVNPVAVPKAETQAARRLAAPARLRSLSGKTVGLFWNGKSGGELALARVRENLGRMFDGVRFVDYLSALTLRASPAQIESMVRDCDAVIGSTAD